MAKKKASSKKATAKKTENTVVKPVQKTETAVKVVRAKGGTS